MAVGLLFLVAILLLIFAEAVFQREVLRRRDAPIGAVLVLRLLTAAGVWTGVNVAFWSLLPRVARDDRWTAMLVTQSGPFSFVFQREALAGVALTLFALSAIKVALSLVFGRKPAAGWFGHLGVSVWFVAGAFPLLPG